MRPLLQRLFATKAVEHSREYFDPFMDKLVSLLPPPLPLARGGSGGGGGGGGGGVGEGNEDDDEDEDRLPSQIHSCAF